MILEVKIIDRTRFELTVPGTNFIKFTEDVIKAGGLIVVQDGDDVWYPISAIRSIRLIGLT